MEGREWIAEKLLVDKIYLTLQSSNMISVIEAVLWLHLRICTLGKFVIFYDITGFKRRGFFHIISIYHQVFK
jgi:hypothetical protein